MPVTGIVYARTKNACDFIAEHFREKGIKAQAYHRGLKAGSLDQVMKGWLGGEDVKSGKVERVDVVIATSEEHIVSLLRPCLAQFLSLHSRLRHGQRLVSQASCAALIRLFLSTGHRQAGCALRRPLGHSDELRGILSRNWSVRLVLPPVRLAST